MSDEYQRQHVHFKNDEYWTSVNFDRRNFYEYLDNPDEYKKKKSKH